MKMRCPSCLQFSVCMLDFNKKDLPPLMRGHPLMSSPDEDDNPTHLRRVFWYSIGEIIQCTQNSAWHAGGALPSLVEIHKAKNVSTSRKLS